MIQDYKLLAYYNFESKKFGHWALIKDFNKKTITSGRRDRSDFIKTIEQSFGKLGTKWHYQKDDSDTFYLKFDDEKDLLMLLLRIHRV